MELYLAAIGMILFLAGGIKLLREKNAQRPRKLLGLLLLILAAAALFYLLAAALLLGGID